MTCCWCHTESPRVRILVEQIVSSYAYAATARAMRSDEANATNRLEANIIELARETLGDEAASRLMRLPIFAVKLRDDQILERP